MLEFVIYLIKSSLLLSVGVALFMLLMKSETFHRFNRWLLLAIVVLSLLFPLVRFSVDSPMARFSSMVELMLKGGDGTVPVSVPPVVYDWDEPIVAQVVADGDAAASPSLWQHIVSFDALHWVLAVYIFVVLLLAVRLLYMYAQVVGILRLGKREEATSYNIKDKSIRLVVHDGQYKPFSWFGWVSISRNDLAECGNEILLHETAHVRCGHSFDILFADFVIVMQWFNPMAWIMKNLLKDIHEYEADSAVLAAGVDARSYQLLIIKKAVGERLYSIANSFNHSLTKKRITMMCKEKSSLWQCTKALYILPLAVVAACTFSSPQNATGDKGSEKVVNGEVSAVDSDAELVYQVVEQQPEYPGGMGELMKFLSRNIKYPAESRQRNSQGKVYVGFVVKKDGSIDNIEVVRTSGDDLLDAEAVRVVKAMPAWVPGKQGGREVNVRFTLPVIFRLQGENVPASPSMNSAVDSDNSLPEVSAVSYANENNEHAYQVVEAQPEFPGGMNELMAFMRDNLKYPDECRKNNIQGKAYVRFVVAKDGTIRDVEIAKSAGNDLLDAEAVRVVKSMPAWVPGKQGGENVNVYFTLPVMYRLQ